MSNSTNDNTVPSAQNGEITLVVDNSIQPLPQYEAIPQRHGLLSMSKQDLELIKWYAGMLARSSFNNSRNPLTEGDYCIIMTKGYSLGYSPENAPDMISIIQGKPVITGAGMLGLILKAKMSGEIEALKIDTQEDYCTVTIKRRGLEPHSETFSMADARRMKTTSWENGQKKTIPLAEKDNWVQQPRTMLKWRAVAAGARAYCPDIIGGLYTVEEMAGDREVVVTDEGLMYLADVPKPTPKPEQKPPMQLHQPNGNGNHAKPPTPAPTFSNGEKTPVEVDPLAITIIPTPPSTSSEPDPNDPEDIRHAIPIYGADHWYVKNYLAFVKLLREVIPNQDSMVNHEVSAEGLRIIGKPIWKDFASGASAITALKAKLGIKDTPAPKPQPTPAPVPVVVAPAPAPQPDLLEWEEDFSQWLWDFLDMPNIGKWEELSGKKVSGYKSYDDAVADATNIAQAKQWTVCSYEATYVKKGEKTTYIEFKGIFPIRMYGRSSTFKTQVGEAYYTANGVDKWEANQTYKIEGLRVTWGRDQNGTAIANKVELVNESDFDLTPEELNVLAGVDM